MTRRGDSRHGRGGRLGFGGRRGGGGGGRGRRRRRLGEMLRRCYSWHFLLPLRS